MSAATRFSPEEASRAWAHVDDRVLPRLAGRAATAVAEPALHGEVAEDVSADLIVQYLEDLGYLPDDGAPRSDTEIEAALDRWRFEAAATTLTIDPERPVDALVRCIGYEGELRLLRAPARGECSLVSRIALFRLRSLCRHRGAPSSPFDDAAEAALQRMSDLLRLSGEDTPLQCLNLLGDAEELTRRFMMHHGTWVFLFDPRRDGEDLLAEKIGDQRAVPYQRLFVATRSNTPGGTELARARKGFFEVKRHHLVGNHRLARRIEARPSENVALTALQNVFGLELLQLRLWLLGHYDGEIDGDWGPLSIAAFESFLVSADESSGKRMYRRLQGGHVAVNLRYVMKELLRKAGDDSRKATREDVDMASAALFAHAERRRRWGELGPIAEQLDRPVGTGIEPLSTSGRRRRRRKRRGLISGVFAAIGGAIRELGRDFRKIGRKLCGALLKLTRSAMNVFRYGLSLARRAVEVCRTAMKRFCHWLLRKPTLSSDPQAGTLAMTKPARDHDTVLFATAGATPELLRFHGAVVAYCARTFYVFGRLAVPVIVAVRSLLTGNWLRLAWRLYELVKDEHLVAVRRALQNARRILVAAPELRTNV